MRLPRPLEKLADELNKLPGIGPKSAERLALYILKLPAEESRELARAIVMAKEKVFPCSVCGCLTDSDPCPICRDDRRNRRLGCLVEETSDVIAIEKAGFDGVYHVLNRSFNFVGGDFLTRLDTDDIVRRLKERGVEEILVATNPDLDGEVVARMVADSGHEQGVIVTRLAHGLPVGGDIEFADEITLRQAIKGRKQI